MEHRKLTRYLISLIMILIMVGLAEWTDEKEILFPEMTALIIGLLIIDKRVWNVKRWQIILLMTLGAAVGICIVRYSPLPYVVNLCAAFAFAGASLLISRATLIPLISACVLPVLLHTESIVYPIAVFSMSVSVVLVQIILPPLMVTFVEMVNSKAGFRNRPTQVFLFLTTVATLGTVLQIVGHHHLHLPESIVALTIAAILFLIFEWTGKYFAPSGALAFIPMLLPQEGLAWLPLEASIGAALFITIAMVVFQKCYKWNRAQLIFCTTPTLLREYMNRKKREKQIE
ncbi:HPP family protein [Bacteroides intestinalis]|uniref:HPP family protein n=1 Tax=Bacteroides intestinalis TaxID=329854 RepID=A0A4Q5H9X5_9BACE|nr:HPP family protein [Bacteroides intestinalis]KAA4693689.1 HPP family protein [Bacteroides intestinalis]KAA4715108.1 HPP family protein [Bacteroides intestinalis]RYT78097.1 HPP family protein [Bacteroides intestinalis]